MAVSGVTRLGARIREFVHHRRFEPYWIEKDSFGSQYDFWIADPAGEHWYSEQGQQSKEHFECGQREMQFTQEHLLSTDDVVFECGAHHGWTTLQLSRFLANGSLHAFEPNRRNYEILEKNLERNQCENVSTNWAAVSATVGHARLYEKSNGSLVPSVMSKAFFSRRLLNRIYGVADVPTISLDDYVDQTGVQPTCLKIDVEGFECEVLAGARKTLESKPSVFIEIHPEHIPMYGGSVEFLLDALDLSRYSALWVQRGDDQTPVRVESLTREDINKRLHVYAKP